MTTTTSRKPRTPGRYGIEEIETSELEPWPNPHTGRNYVVRFEIPEFTCLCPRSGYPDFATLVIEYVPGPSIVELRSLKLYINKFRDRQVSHEAVSNEILDTLVDLLAPRWMRLVAEFNVRGNIKTTITTEHVEPGYAGPRPAYTRPTFTGI